MTLCRKCRNETNVKKVTNKCDRCDEPNFTIGIDYGYEEPKTRFGEIVICAFMALLIFFLLFMLFTFGFTQAIK